MKQLRCILTLGMLLAPALAHAQDEVVYFHTDAIGSVRMITDGGGAVIARYDYLPFGERWDSPPNPNPDVRQFAGNERDFETALDYVGARYYRPPSGLFTTGDPGHIGGDIFNPQSWNSYAYALNNPLRYVDPLGLYEWEARCADETCEAERQRFRDAYALMIQTFGNTTKGSEEYRVLDGIIKKIGTEGDGNKVRVAFSSTQTDFGTTEPTISGGRLMTFNFSKVDSYLAGFGDAAIGLAGASLVVHEGQHATEGLGFAGRWLATFGRTRVHEERAYGAESLFYRAMGAVEPFYSLWDPSWPAADRERLRLAAVRAASRR